MPERLGRKLAREAEEISKLPEIFNRLSQSFDLSPQGRLGRKLIPPGSSRERLFMKLLRSRSANPDTSQQAGVLEVARNFGPGIADSTRSVAEDLREIGYVAEQNRRSLAVMMERGTQRGPNYVPYEPGLAPPSDPAVRLIAFYLTQFHPIPENDAWWGRGFTEWTSVSKAVPQLVGQYQPHLPDELGFYDLRIRDIQERQVEIARLYGIHGFAFYYYWFGGKRLLERPLDSFLANGKIDFPFCLIWANENWTRRWDGREDDVLMAQDHSPESDSRFIEDLAPYLCHPNYIRIDGRPLIGVYRANQLPNPKQTLATWRAYCVEHGFGDPYIVAAQTFGFENAVELGFDAAMQFPPHNENSDVKYLLDHHAGRLRATNQDCRVNAYSYPALVRHKICDEAEVAYPRFETAFPMWDNTPRVPETGIAFMFSSPKLYELWLKKLCERAIQRNATKEARIVFINAWNEWAEGAHLEPDRRYGFAFPRATRQALDSVQNGPPQPEASAEVDEELAKTPRKPILIYEMGHVGLDSLPDSAVGVGFDPIICIRRLLPVGAPSCPPIIPPEDTQAARLRQMQVANWMKSADEKTIWRVVTGVRDPVARNVAAFIEVLPQLIPNLKARYMADDIAAEELHELFLNFFDEKTPENWFETQFEPVTGIDVYGAPFPHEKGFQTYENGHYRALVVRAEDSDRIGLQALEEFLGVKRLSMVTNVADAMAEDLTILFEEAPLPTTYVDRQISTRYATHFYTPEELRAARLRWTSQ